MVPEFADAGLLPHGIHSATWDEFERRFAVFTSSDRRFRIRDQLKRLFDDTARSGVVKRFIVAGSFVTDKAEPNDFDCILVLAPDIVGRSLRPAEYSLVSRSSARRIYGGDVVPVIEGSTAEQEYLAFFQTDREGRHVGLVEVTQ